MRTSVLVNFVVGGLNMSQEAFDRTQDCAARVAAQVEYSHAIVAFALKQLHESQHGNANSPCGKLHLTRVAVNGIATEAIALLN